MKTTQNKYLLVLLSLIFIARLLSAQPSAELPKFKGHHKTIHAIAFSPDGKYIATASDDNTVKIWRRSDGHRIETLKHSDDVLAVTFSNNSKIIASGGRDNVVKTWEVETGKNLRTFKGHEQEITSLCFGPEDEMLVSGSADCSLRLWKMNKWRSDEVFTGHKARVNDVDFGPQGQYILSASDDQTIKVWDLTINRARFTYYGHTHYVKAVKFNRNGDYLVSASYDKQLMVWKMWRRNPVKILKGHDFGVNAVDFSADSKYIVSASDDNTIKLWNFQSGENIFTFFGHEHPVTDINFSPNWKYLASCSESGDMRMWNLASVYPNKESLDNEPTDVNIWAVVVGVARYFHKPSLKYSVNDALRIYGFLKSPQGGALADHQIKIITDDGAEKELIVDAMHQIYEQADTNDVIVFYFSGHGEEGAFLPYDFDGTSNHLWHNEIMEILNQYPARHKLCIADACHAGGMVEEVSQRSGVNHVIADYRQAIKSANSGIALFMSSKAQETSLEYKGLRQGVFSYYFIEGLKGKANKNNDNIVNISELFDYVYQQVRNYTGNYQSPVLKGSFDNQMPLSIIR